LPDFQSDDLTGRERRRSMSDRPVFVYAAVEDDIMDAEADYDD
jgi:hypothetical protein